jgi:hypothetical protein
MHSPLPQRRLWAEALAPLPLTQWALAALAVEQTAEQTAALMRRAWTAAADAASTTPPRLTDCACTALLQGCGPHTAPCQTASAAALQHPRLPRTKWALVALQRAALMHSPAPQRRLWAEVPALRGWMRRWQGSQSSTSVPPLGGSPASRTTSGSPCHSRHRAPATPTMLHTLVSPTPRKSESRLERAPRTERPGRAHDQSLAPHRQRFEFE